MENDLIPDNRPDIQKSKSEIVVNFSGNKPKLPEELYGNPKGLANFLGFGPEPNTHDIARQIDNKDLIIIHKDGRRVIHTAERIDEEVAKTKVQFGNSRVYTKLFLMQSLVDKERQWVKRTATINTDGRGSR